MTNLLFIGAGRMAEAIFAGMIQNDPTSHNRIVVSNRSDEARLAALKKEYGVRTTPRWTENVPEADVILLAMPPEAHDHVLAELGPLLSGQFVVTVAAGIGVKKLEEALPAGCPVAWVMPNTAADMGESISLFACGDAVNTKHRRMLQDILDAIGASEECTERQIHELTAITGSAPAFIYRMAEVLEEAAMDYGIGRDRARRLVTQMIHGSGAMLKKGGGTPAELREQVTTPGGATAAGLKVFAENDFRGIVKRAVKAVNARAEEQAES